MFAEWKIQLGRSDCANIVRKDLQATRKQLWRSFCCPNFISHNQRIWRISFQAKTIIYTRYAGIRLVCNYLKAIFKYVASLLRRNRQNELNLGDMKGQKRIDFLKWIKTISLAVLSPITPPIYHKIPSPCVVANKECQQSSWACVAVTEAAIVVDLVTVGIILALATALAISASGWYSKLELFY